jgi:hypothetical protein
MIKKTWYTKKVNERGEGIIDRVQITRENEKPLLENLGWIEAPENCNLHEETPIARYDENMRYIDDDGEWLKKQGKTDLRGNWYNKETRETKLVNDIEETVDETEWTREIPIENEAYQKFDNKKNKWVVDTEKKDAAEKQSAIAAKEAEIEAVEKKRLRPMFAINDNLASDDDVRLNEEYKQKILDLRAEIRELKKSA